MRIALLIGANPRLTKSGPLCALDRSKSWGWVSENLKDTVFEIEEFIPKSDTETERRVKVNITKPGTESYISIFAVSV